MTANEIRLGALSDIFAGPDENFMHWLANRVAKEGYETIAEFLQDHLLDDYLNSVGDQGSSPAEERRA